MIPNAPAIDDLERDTRGAMLVIGLFSAVLITGLLYYVIGIGETIVHRETMQDAADAGAFSAAVVHARGMNLIVLINLIMAAALAILVALKLVLTITLAAIIVCIALAYPTAGASLSPVPSLGQLAQQTQNVINQVQPRIFDLLRAGRQTAHVVRRIMPPIAAIRAVQVAGGPAFASDVEFGVPLPIGIEPLPTEDDRFEVLCDHAGRVVGDVVMMPFSSIPGMGPVSSFVSDAIGGLASAFSAWFCGAGGSGGPPSLRRDIETYVPQSDAAQRCSRDRSSAACDEARRLEDQARPTSDGSCPAAGTPGSAWCEERATRARRECAPATSPSKVSFQRAVRRRFFWIDPASGRAMHTEAPSPRVTDPRLADETVSGAVVESSGYPRCAPDGQPRDPNHPEADLCGRIPPDSPGAGVAIPNGRDRAVSIDFEVYTRIHSCVITRQETLQPSGDRGYSQSQQSEMAPQRLANKVGGEDVVLGGEIFQMRFFVLGRSLDARWARGVGIASWGRQVPRDGALDAVAVLGRLAVAQAEYFYPSTDPRLADRPEWMWNMRWRARFREFTTPRNGLGPVSSALGGSGGGLGLIERVVSH